MIFTEGDAVQSGDGAFHPDQPQVINLIQDCVGDRLAVSLMYHEIDVRMQTPESGKDFRKDIGGRDRGGPELEDLPFFAAAASDHAVLHVEDADGISVYFLSFCRQLYVLCGPDNQGGVQFRLQLPDMRADGRLGDVENPGSFCKTALLRDGDERSQLFKFHDICTCFFLRLSSPDQALPRVSSSSALRAASTSACVL